MQYLWDEKGKQYLDALCRHRDGFGRALPSVRLSKKVREQVGKLQHVTTIYLHPTIGQFGKKLAEHIPEGSNLSVTYFTNSGSEANEIAILSAREFTGNTEVISLRNGYHGGTQATMGLTAHSTWKFKTNPTDQREKRAGAVLLPLPVRIGISELRVEVCPRRGECDQVRNQRAGGVRSLPKPIQGVGGTIDAAAGVFQHCVRHRSQSRRAVHCRRSASRLRPHRRTFLGLRKFRRHARSWSRWPKASATALRWGPASRGRKLRR